MSTIIRKDENTTIIATITKKYVINQTPKGIELLIGPIKEKTGVSDEIEFRLWLPIGTRTTKDTTENLPEVAIWPIPLKVLEDIQERNSDIKIEDISEHYIGSASGNDFFVQIKAYAIMTTM